MIKKFKLIGLDCANCAAKIERDLRKTNGVFAVSVNPLTEKLIIEAEDNAMEDIIAKAETIVKKYESHVEMRAL